MSATITWVIEWMQCKPTDGSYTNAVINAGWRCNGVQSAGTPAVEYLGSVYGTCSFSQPAEGGSFTPFAELTQDQVLAWCWANNVNKAGVEAGVQESIDNSINPPVTQPALPWAPVESA